MAKFTLRDSGERVESESGAMREPNGERGRFDLVSPRGLRRLAVIYEKGAVKYAPRNWEKGMPISGCINSALRHINGYLSGDNVEDHLAQAAWNLFAAMHFEEGIERGEYPAEYMDIPVRHPDDTQDAADPDTEEQEYERRAQDADSG